jgi:transposase-like protein
MAFFEVQEGYRNSPDYASWKERKQLASTIRHIYTAASAEAAEAELNQFKQGPWGQKFPMVVASWRCATSHRSGTVQRTTGKWR